MALHKFGYTEEVLQTRLIEDISSKRVSTSSGGGGGWKTLCIKIGYSEPT